MRISIKLLLLLRTMKGRNKSCVYIMLLSSLCVFASLCNLKKKKSSKCFQSWPGLRLLKSRDVSLAVPSKSNLKLAELFLGNAFVFVQGHKVCQLTSLEPTCAEQFWFI